MLSKEAKKERQSLGSIAIIRRDTSIMDFIDRIFYINLKHREDRKSELLHECERLQIPMQKVERFNAIKNPALPWVGCSQSHLEVLGLAKERKYQIILVLEDDANFHASSELFHRNLTRFFNEQGKSEWKVCMLAANLIRSEEVNPHAIVHYVREAQSGAAYLVHCSFYDALIAQYTYGILCAKIHGPYHWLYINDQVWKPLQTGAWYVFQPLLAYQRPSYSDLYCRMVDYKGQA